MPIAPDNYLVLKDGKFDLTNGTGPDGLTREFQVLATSHLPFAQYFHGGLVGLASGEAQAKTLNDLLATKADSFFLIWETAITDVIENSLSQIFSEAIFQKILRRVTQFVKGKADKAKAPASVTKAIDPLPLTR